MKKRKLRGFVLPSIYIITIVALAISLTLLTRNIMFSSPTVDNYDYSVNVFNEDEEQTQLVNENVPSVTKPSKPYIGENVTVTKEFYDIQGTPENQEQALIYYENTYMQNSGVLYSSENSFDIVTVLDGKVAEIKEDEILGNVLVIDHGNELKSTYQSLNDIKVKVGDEVKQGDIIAQSGENKLNNSSKNSLLFEVYNKGQLILKSFMKWI